MIDQRLKQLRTDKKLTQAELSYDLGIAKTTLAAYEQGKSEPSIETLIKISDYFDVTVDYLIGKIDCIHQEYQPAADLLGVDEKTLEILIDLSKTDNSSPHLSNLDMLEAIIQHPNFKAWLYQIRQYITFDALGWSNIRYQVPDSNSVMIEKVIPSDIVKSSSMQQIQTTIRGIIEGIPFSKHFSKRSTTTSEV